MSTTSHEPSSPLITIHHKNVPRVVVQNLHVLNEFKSTVSVTIRVASASSSTPCTSRNCNEIERLLTQEMPNEEEEEEEISRGRGNGITQTLPCSHLGFDLLVLRQPSIISSALTTIGSVSSCPPPITAAEMRKKRKLDEDVATDATSSLKLFVINVKPGSIAFDALLKEGDEVVQWMGEAITSLRQFYYGISKCPTLWLTLRRVESTFEKKQRLTIEQYLRQKNCDDRHQQQSSTLPEMHKSNDIFKSIFSIITNHPVINFDIQSNPLLQHRPSIPSTEGSNRVVAASDTNTKRAKATTINECISTVNANEQTKESQISTTNNKSHNIILVPPPTCTYLSSSSSLCSSTFSESYSTCSSSIATVNISTIAANCNPPAPTLGRKRTKRSPKELETIESFDNQKVNSKKKCSVITPVQLPPIPPLDDSIFSLPIDEKNLPRSWKKMSSGYIHIESGIRVYNSREMNRVLQLLFYYAPNSTSHVEATSMSVQEAVRRSRMDYKGYKVRLAANQSEPVTTATPTAAAAAMITAKSKEVTGTHKSSHFYFDVQQKPRGWLRFCDTQKGKPLIYWKHSLTQRKVKDPLIMPRVLQLLEEQCSGKSITVKEAIKQAMEEKDNGLYTVTVVDSNNSGGNGSSTRRFLSESGAISNPIPKPTSSSKRYPLNNLPPAWKKVQGEVNAYDGKRKKSHYLHLESGLKVHEARLMPRIIELLEKKQKPSNNNVQEILSVKDAIRMAREEVVSYSQPMKF